MIRSGSKLIVTSTAIGALVGSSSLVAGLALFLSGVPDVRAEIIEKPAVHQLQAKGDRLLVLTKGTACSSHGWPHYEQSCQFDMRRPADQARTVRIVALR